MNDSFIPRPRRAFLRQGVMAGIVAGAFRSNEIFSLAIVPTARQKNAAAKRLLRSTFTPHLSEYFTVSDATVSLLLLNINDLAAQRASFASGKLTAREIEQQREASFALLFRGPREIALLQDTYRLRHPNLGELSVFLVPIGQVADDATWRDYEAVFNRASK